MTVGAFTRPNRATPGSGVALPPIACATSALVAFGFSANASPAMPDTIGADDDVPQNST